MWCTIANQWSTERQCCHDGSCSCCQVSPPCPAAIGNPASAAEVACISSRKWEGSCNKQELRLWALGWHCGTFTIALQMHADKHHQFAEAHELISHWLLLGMACVLLSYTILYRVGCLELGYRTPKDFRPQGLQSFSSIIAHPSPPHQSHRHSCHSSLRHCLSHQCPTILLWAAAPEPARDNLQVATNMPGIITAWLVHVPEGFLGM